MMPLAAQHSRFTLSMVLYLVKLNFPLIIDRSKLALDDRFYQENHYINFEDLYL